MLPFFLILIGLGIWQLQRLGWKERLIAEMYSHMRAPPLNLDEALKLGDAAQYRRVALIGSFDNAKEAFVFATADGAPIYHVVAPFTLADSRTLLVDRGYILTTMRPAAFSVLAGQRTVVGVWRTPDAPTFFTAKPDLAHRTWYARDLSGIAKADSITLAAPVIIEADATPNPGGWPKGGQTVVDLPNDHIQYAIIWFGLAVVAFGVWLGWHISRQRLVLGRKNVS